MGRLLAWVFGIGLLVFIIGLVISTIAPSAAGEYLAIAGVVLIASVAVAAMVRAQRSRGWERVVNPGAARREYLAEQEALAKRHPAAGSSSGPGAEPPR